MKFFKYSLIAAIALSGVFTSCDDDDDYVPGPKSPGVYFTTQSQTESVMELEPVQFEVNVARYDVTGEADYAITATTEAAGVFTVPASVHFAADQNETTLSVTCDAAAIGYGKKAAVSLSFGDGVAVSEYGNNTLTLTVNVAEPYQTIGKAQYIETCFSEVFDWADYGITNTTMMELEIQESLLKPGYYRLVNLYGPLSKYFGFIWEGETFDEVNSYFYIDATNPDKVFVPAQYTGMDFNPNYGDIMIMSDCQENLSGGYSNIYGKLADNVITFPKGALLMYLPLYNEGTFFTCNGQGNAVVVLPGGVYGDYSANISYSGLFNNASDGTYKAVCSVELGSDVDEAKVAMVKAANADAAVKAVTDGSVESMTIKPTGDVQQVFLPIDGEGTYFATVVTYANGTVQKSATARTNITIASGGGESEWEDFGTGAIIDGWCTARFSFQNGYTYEDVIWEFPVQRNKKDHNLLRLVNLYTSDPEANFLVYSGYNSNTANTYVVVDMTNPSAVAIEPQWGGMTWNPDKDKTYGGADWIIGNYLGYAISEGLSLDQAIEAVEGEVDAIVDGVLSIAIPMFADPSTGQFGYSWKDKEGNTPYSAIQFSNLVPASAPAKVGRATVQRIHAIMNSSMRPARIQSNHSKSLRYNATRAMGKTL